MRHIGSIGSELSRKVLLDLHASKKKKRSGGRSYMNYHIGKRVSHIEFSDLSQFILADSF